MFKGWLLISVILAYLCLIFFIAWLAEKREKKGRSLVSNPLVYSLSMAVFCSSWTFYGSVGRAATSSGLSFLTVYLGPTLMMALSPLLLRKVIRISKENRITSISDFLGARYGNSLAVAAFAAFIAFVGIAPYLGLQLKAIIETFSILSGQKEGSAFAGWVITLALGVFAIIFGARKLDSSERHEGLVFAIAFESLIKLAAFLCVGIYVSFFLFGGVSDIFARIGASRFSSLVSIGGGGSAPGYGQWASLLVLSMSAIFFLPRQFQVSVVENSDESHISTAVWLFPLYLLLMNLFVMPIAFGGLLLSGSQAGADNFVLTIPLSQGRNYLALFAFIGGFSAATGMVIVGSVAISTMVMNNLVMPAVYKLDRMRFLLFYPQVVLNLKRLVILGCVFMGYAFAVHVGEFYSLVDIGLQSFEAVTIFAPAFLIGLYWKGGNRKGALAGMSAGFAVWVYTLLLPALIKAGVVPDSGLLSGAIHSALLNPEALFGIRGLDRWTNSLLWGLLFNTIIYMGVSLATSPDEQEEKQAFLFVESCPAGPLPSAGNYGFEDLRDTLGQYIGWAEAAQALDAFMRANAMSREQLDRTGLVRLRDETRRVLSGSLGPAIASMIIEDRVTQTEKEKSQVLDSIRRMTRTLRLSRSELEEANSKLGALKEFSENILESLPLGVATLDGALRVKYWNRAMEKITGMPAAEAMEKEASRILDCMAPGFFKQDNFEKARAGKAILCKAGSKILNGYLNALKGGDGGFVLVFEDITEKKRIEEELFRATKHASLGRLAAGVSHEIGNPLASISSLVQELMEEDLSQAEGSAFAKDSMAVINRHIERIVRIVRSLSDFARLHPGQKTPTSLREILQNTLDLVKYDRGFRNIELDLKIEEVPALKLDADRMQQVFLNIILNARDAMPEGGKLGIWMTVADGHVLMVFSDTGEGMDETQKEKAFEPFYTTKSTAAPTGGTAGGARGTGLGLSICYSIIKDHGGSIEAVSKKGEGTSFIIKVPAGDL